MLVAGTGPQGRTGGPGAAGAGPPPPPRAGGGGGPPKVLQNALKNIVEKGHPKKEAQGSILEHFEELFGRLFGSKNAPGATSDRFFGEVRDSVNTLVFTIHSKGSSGLELTKKRLRG